MPPSTTLTIRFADLEPVQKLLAQGDDLASTVAEVIVDLCLTPAPNSPLDGERRRQISVLRAALNEYRAVVRAQTDA